MTDRREETTEKLTKIQDDIEEIKAYLSKENTIAKYLALISLGIAITAFIVKVIGH